MGFILDDFDVKLERLETLNAICAYSLSDNPEEDAKEKIMSYAKSKGLMEKTSISRLFGRNTYPTKNPEPHGYEFYLTHEKTLELEGDLKAIQIPSGLYAVLKFKNLFNIAEAWATILKWIANNPYESANWVKGDHGWVGGYEEHINWKEEKPPTEWILKLWVKLKE